MSQDNALFRQLLTLHDSISALKSAPIHAFRPPSPSSLDSFTEEEEEDEEDEEQDDEDEEEKEDNESHMSGENLRQQKTSKVEDLSEVDEGLETDHSTSHSTSPSSTLSSKCSWNSNFSSSSKVQLPTPGRLPHIVRGSSAAPVPSSPVEQVPLEASTHATPATQTDAESFTSVTNITSSKYSITTNEDFNINIAINSNNTGSAFTSGTSQRSISTSCLSKSSCYISSTTPEPNITKTFGGSLGSFSQQDGTRFTRTRVSIPPSARNRDRSARPESFRLSSDMASHTRVLLKARSFGGASLRESITNKYKKGRDYSRSSLREDHLRNHHHSSVSKVEFQQTGFATASGEPSVTVTNPSSQCSKTEVVHESSNSIKEQLEGANFHQKQTTSIKETSIVIINTVTRQEEVCHESSQGHEAYEDTAFNDQESRDPVSNQWSEPPRKPYSRASSLSSSLAVAENELLPKYKTSVMITDSGSDRDFLDCSRAQMVRARSFTGLMTPRGTTSSSPSPTREILEGSGGTAFLKIPLGENCERLQQVTPMIRRARTSRDGKTLRFSSDLGFGARPKSKREVFV
ncbi:nuclear pore complex protein DDB_G0274915-like isoform X2 [Scylla paramamosain]|uniref:nuclear pore complex protein DDB_G0274915-like isoform X2 n=1 Tax=Scylla paramamosain TaxID=85552 RepID=UPI00308314DF